MSEQTEPQVITLDDKNSIEILASYIEVAQKAGTFVLQESDILKRCRDLLLKGTEDAEINVPTAKNLFVQGIIKGQSKGCYTLDDSFILYKVCAFVTQNIDKIVPASSPQQVTNGNSPQVSNDDLSTLSDPVPIKSSGPRTV